MFVIRAVCLFGVVVAVWSACHSVSRSVLTEGKCSKDHILGNLRTLETYLCQL